jgi:hypothetical protein
MNIERLQFLHNYNHVMGVELEADDYGYRSWTPVRESDISGYIEDMARWGYSLSDIDHHDSCECKVTDDEWMFYMRALDILRTAR